MLKGRGYTLPLVTLPVSRDLASWSLTVLRLSFEKEAQVPSRAPSAKSFLVGFYHDGDSCPLLLTTTETCTESCSKVDRTRVPEPGRRSHLIMQMSFV